MKKFTLIFVLLAALVFVGLPPVFAEEKSADKPAVEETVKPAETKDADIGETLDAKTVGKLLSEAIAASQNKGSFWRNPALWEVVFTALMLLLGFLAAKFGWNKKKWGKVIKSIETSVRTVYVEFIREAKIKAKAADGKLSAEDMKKALEEAWNKSEAALKDQNIDLAKWIAKEYFPIIVDRIIKKTKKVV